MRLPVPRATLVDADVRTSAYHTSSFWRYLAERYALDGDMPGPEDLGDLLDYGYLARMFAMGPPARDCAGEDAACASELRWLDAGLRTVFGSTLRYEYPRFVDAFSRYGEERIDRGGEGDNWRETGFDGCPAVRLGRGLDERIRRDIVETLAPVGAECWSVSVQGFPEGVRVAMTVEGPAARAMSDLSASVGGRPTWADTAIVEGDAETERSSVTWSYPVPDDTPTPFLLSNVGSDPGAAVPMQNLPVTFTLLESAGRIVGREGPGSEAIDAPVGLELDDFPIAEVMPFTAPHSGADFERPCVLRFRMRNRETGDEVTLRLDHEGPIRPGPYSVAARRDGADHLDASEHWPGEFVVDFAIGRRSPLSDGRPQAFRAEAGTVEIQSVTAGVVRGRVSATGWRRQVHAVDEEPWGLGNLGITADFVVVVRDRVRRVRLGRDAPPGSDCLAPRRE